MKAVLGVAAALLVSVILQICFTGLSPRPDGVVAAALAMAFLRGPELGGATGFFGGLIQDALSGSSRGIFSFLGLLLGVGFGFLFKRTYSQNILIPFIGILGGSLVHFFLLRQMAAVFGWAHVDSVPHWKEWLLIQGSLGIVFLYSFRRWFVASPFEV